MSIEQEYEDWKRCRWLWQEMMRIEAADVGYDFAAGRRAREAYLKACAEYREKHGEPFDPDVEWVEEEVA